MNAEDYRAGLQSLGMTQLDFGKFIGVSPRTAQAYAASGPSGPAAVVMAMLLWLTPTQRDWAMRYTKGETWKTAKPPS